MKKRIIRGLLPVLVLGSLSVQAQGPYIGLKLGAIDVDQRGFDNAVNGGLLLGYDIYSDAGLAWGVEAELTASVADGDFSAAGARGDWDINTQALYGVFKFGDAVYGKVKAGVLREEVTARAGGFSADETESNASLGAGVGWRPAPNVSFEAEYTQIEEDAAFWSLGANYLF